MSLSIVAIVCLLCAGHFTYISNSYNYCAKIVIFMLSKQILKQGFGESQLPVQQLTSVQTAAATRAFLTHSRWSTPQPAPPSLPSSLPSFRWPFSVFIGDLYINLTLRTCIHRKSSYVSALSDGRFHIF